MAAAHNHRATFVQRRTESMDSSIFSLNTVLMAAGILGLVIFFGLLVAVFSARNSGSDE